MNLSARDLAVSALFIITNSSLVCIIFQTVWWYFYAVVNFFSITIISLFIYSWPIKKNNLIIRICFSSFHVDISYFSLPRKYS